MSPVSTFKDGFTFDPATAPADSKFKTPSWVKRAPVTPGEPQTLNGLGEPWDWKKPTFHGIDLTKVDPRVKVKHYEIADANLDSKIAFVDVNILDSTGKLPYKGDVLIKGKYIVSVGTKLSEEELTGARIFEGKGRTLMSGMVDAHTHFTWTNAGSLEALATMEPEEHTLFSARSARTFLDCGYTQSFGAASAKQRIDVVIRNAINNGEIPGPRHLANSLEIAPTGGALEGGITAFADGPDEARAVVRAHIEKFTVDNIKLSMSGEEINENLRAEDTTFDDANVAAAVDEAHSLGARVCSHARSDESVLQCLQYGVDVIYHASFISDATMDALEVQKDRVFVAPAINSLYGILYDAEAYGYPQSKAESVGYKRELEIAIASMKEMHRRGIRILPGGDYGFAWTPHGSYRDPELFVKLLGMKPMDVILATTALGGELMGRPNELGKVQPGFFADVILVNGDPLEDMGVLSNHKNINVVIMNGHVHKFPPDDGQVWYEPSRSLMDEAQRSKKIQEESNAAGLSNLPT
ncbi:hypothetical protein FIBSPDRAFT_859157 [Athelia psychrophila]|uniref:Amidohydrolase-related domain-containing protein n=1 Tax=Athelia psychrophila TaxID=1759441 RepID=A0A166LH19_9AGAM|nr:hypothetical protein FIBSPDRAFT_859157 [Fibularhizoctonia sp. CBS 109695]